MSRYREAVQILFDWMNEMGQPVPPPKWRSDWVAIKVANAALSLDPMIRRLAFMALSCPDAPIPRRVLTNYTHGQWCLNDAEPHQWNDYLSYSIKQTFMSRDETIEWIGGDPIRDMAAKEASHISDLERSTRAWSSHLMPAKRIDAAIRSLVLQYAVNHPFMNIPPYQAYATYRDTAYREWLPGSRDGLSFVDSSKGFELGVQLRFRLSVVGVFGRDDQALIQIDHGNDELMPTILRYIMPAFDFELQRFNRGAYP